MIARKGVKRLGNIWYVNPGTMTQRGYYKVRKGGRNMYAHHLIHETFRGYTDYSRESGGSNSIDHLNGDKTDNSLANLEVVSHRENVRRAISKHGTPPYVHLCTRGNHIRFNVAARLRGKLHWGGGFKTVEEAASAVPAFLQSIGHAGEPS